MKATIDGQGTLKICAESELESFALREWSEKHFSKTETNCMLLINMNVLVEPAYSHTEETA